MSKFSAALSGVPSASRALLAAAMLLPCSTVLASTLTFDYTGAPLTYGPPGNQPQVSYGPDMTGVLTVDSSLVPQDFSGTLTSGFTVSLGSPSFGQYSGCVIAACRQIAQPSVTFQNGVIVAWQFGTETPQSSQFGIVDMLSTSSGDDHFIPFSVQGPFPSAESSAPGSWSEVSAVPLPPSVSMLGLALFGLGGLSLLRRRAIGTLAATAC